ncbi:carnitine O-acetyltransferase isoform X2 [Sinocyclocheilus anshuiensis]|uniref:Carnitine O-acetyltransferase n=1 Tax=Sinocyclocheilus anshuiensis TaxID=1608454 RepID=A0A671RDC8_9TELE|nr:PREDICTED: carnitine O-acetyltransferase-like isoform X1 [Sinocyclocheilus anshuiensis]XP_016360774.1 PREDICTED: carnitine O-acetyltransferase-like isoform X2 [Sinocyclocheilus anshuiensis]
MLCVLTRTATRTGLVKPCRLLSPLPVVQISERPLVHQESLLKLPVPPLQQTCVRYLASLEPLISEEEMTHTHKLMDEFLRPGGVGERLQKSLERRARKTENWLTDWWMQSSYLDSRMPVAMYTSPGVVLPKMHLQDRQGQMRFAAKLIAGVLDFKSMIDSDTLPVEYLGGKPLCMDQYYRVLSSCRIPGPKRDTVVNYAIGKTPPTHITVVHNFQFFVLDVYNSDGSPLTVDQLYVQLEKIWNSSLQTNKEPVGILTSNHRNTWGKAYNNLIKDKTNKESVRAIQKSIFTVCLDAPKPRVSDEMYFNKVAAQMLHGGGSRWNSGNRWFDKTLQFIIGEDGSCGLTYEHAPAEGPPIVFLVDHVVDYMKRSEMVRTPMIPLSMPQKLRFNITPEIKKDIEKAKQNMNIMVHDLDVRVLNFTHYGRKFPKSHKMSPDAFIQMAFQLAYYRMYQTCCPTYESTSLRMFKLGRTEAIRSTTTESLQFTKAMDDPSKHNSEKAALLEKAIKVHRKHTHMAIHGQGIERHMLGLKMIAIEDLTSLPEIFMDTSFAVASHFNLYTSQVGSKTDCVMCLGPMVPDGYGICYNPMDDHINFAVTAFNSCEETNATKLSQFLEDSLLDMKTLLEQVSKTQ